MARRFDLTGSGSAAVSPNFGSLWASTGGAVRRPLPAARTTSTQTGNGVAEAVTTNAYDVATHQWVSDETFASAGTCDPGNFDTLLLCLESSSSMNAYMQVVIRVTSGDGLTERGVLYAGQTATSSSGTATDPNAEFDTTFSRVRRLTAATTPVVVQVGDRLVLEYGYRACNTSGTSMTGTLTPGSTSGTDLTTAQVNGTSTNRPWIEFVNDPFTVTAGTVTGTLAGTLQTKTASFTAFAQGSATLAGDLQRKTAVFETWANADGTLAGTLQQKTAAFTLDAHPIATLAGDLQPKTAAFNINIEDAAAELALSSTLQPKTAAFTAEVIQNVTLAGDLQPKTATFSLLTASDITLAGSLQAKTATFEMSTLERPIRIAGTLRRKTSSITLKIPPYILLAGTLRSKVGDFELTKPPVTDFTNRASGLELDGYGVAVWSPAVVDPPAAIAPVHDFDVARVYTEPTLVNGRPVDLVTTTARKPRLRDRVLVNGKDITYWRGIQTPTPAYQLIDPLLYGPGRLSLPQVSLAFGEQVGVGDLSWLKPDAVVKVQRVDPETSTVEATDYIGIITRFDVDGNTLVCELGGIVAGYAADMERQAVIFRKVKDAGNWVYSAVTQAAPVAFTPRLGPNTGIDLVSIGGMGHLDWINTLCSLSVTDDGEQYTVGRRDDGTWGMWLKDLETIHATVYFDDADMKPSLVRDTSEEPTRVFAFGIDDEGRRLNNAKYPGLQQGEAPDYPFAAGTPFGLGTTDDDTDDPDLALITAMLNMMVTVGLISSSQNTGTYTAAVVRAVKDLQDDAGLSETGIMNPATWAALWDLSVTGYSLANSRYEPMAQRPSTKKWMLSSSGAIIGRNPNYQPRKRKVDRTIQAGSGLRGKPQLRRFAKHKLGSDDNWIGSFTAHLAFVAGEHTPGDPIDASDVMSARDIKPGMNIWAPFWDGGTLFHVPGVQVPEGGRAPTIALDTGANPSLDAWQRIQRNKESRLDPSRIWLRQNRSSQMSKDVKEWDSVCGWINDRVFCEGGRWTVFATPAGQAGTISRLRIRTDNEKTRHAIAVFAKGSDKRLETGLNRRNPNPLTEAGTEKWDKPAMVNWLEDRGRVFIAGGYHQAGGYFPGKEWEDQSDEATGDPITGVSDTQASFGYHTFAEPVLYVAVWVEDDCWVKAGRVMWGQLDSVY